MKISVIVSTYNRPDALEKVLDGLLHQTRLPDEIIVADDGSGRETGDMLRPYLDNSDIDIIHVWHEDKGFRLAEIRNKAIARAGGRYLVFLDGDCIPERHFVQDHLDLARTGCFFQGKRVIVNKHCTPFFRFRDTVSLMQRLKHLACRNISNGHHIFRLCFFPSYTTAKLSGIRGCNMGFFKKDLVAVNGFNQEFTGWGREDSELVARLYRYGLKRRENPFRAICYHLWHRENSRTGLGRNDELLEKTLQARTFYCTRGIKSPDDGGDGYDL
jgi:glycosyltransferase involved in cell wall biosynthesis